MAHLAERLRKAKQTGLLSAAEESELAELAGDAVQLAGTTQDLLQDIRAFGRIPKEVRGSSEAQLQERSLAQKLRKAKQAGRLSAAQESELAELAGDSHPC